MYLVFVYASGRRSTPKDFEDTEEFVGDVELSILDMTGFEDEENDKMEGEKEVGCGQGRLEKRVFCFGNVEKDGSRVESAKYRRVDVCGMKCLEKTEVDEAGEMSEGDAESFGDIDWNDLVPEREMEGREMDDIVKTVNEGLIGGEDVIGEAVQGMQEVEKFKEDGSGSAMSSGIAFERSSGRKSCHIRESKGDVTKRRSSTDVVKKTYPIRKRNQ